MSDNNKDFVHKINRPDYYTIIKRRKRSVTDILAEHGVDNLKKLKQFKNSLEGTYSVSQEFMDDAECVLHEMSLSKETLTSLDEGIADIKAGRVVPLDVDKFLEEKPKTPPKKKKTTKKKPKKKTTKKDVNNETK